MTKPKPTPGPWRVGSDIDRVRYNQHGELPEKYMDCQVTGPSGEEVVPIRIDHYEPMWDGDFENWPANARLIASAPDLLAAAEDAWRVLCWAAQESEGKVKKEIVGGWLDHAARLNTIIERAKGE